MVIDLGVVKFLISNSHNQLKILRSDSEWDKIKREIIDFNEKQGIELSTKRISRKTRFFDELGIDYTGDSGSLFNKY